MSVAPERMTPRHALKAALPESVAYFYQALTTGLRDYVGKNGFERVVLGLSGGIDSALVAAMAVDALGPVMVRTVMMPSPYTSAESKEDALAVARSLGCRLDSIPITEAMQAFEHALAPAFVGCHPDVTEENIQARCRGLILMALANKSGAMVLAPGNKSEMATGYATLYGDMCGGFAPLKDVYKTRVYELARWRNTNKPANAQGPTGSVIPERVLTKAPTAELRFDQTDQDTLPPYDILDGILACLIEKDLTLSDVVARGYDARTVRRVWAMLGRAEHKRRQGPPGPKVTSRHLTRDRRYPITNKGAG
jgi:NAD+ synthase